ncbi:MAG: RNA pseudouridine synthase [Flavobacteriales bacterium]|nr:RNA pseudouridine synthase [Flavobacteriales bacterium]
MKIPIKKDTIFISIASYRDEVCNSTLKSIYSMASKPQNVFCGVVHRLDRPTSGVVVFAKTSKALERLNAQFREKETNKTYWAIVENKPKELKGSLRDYLKKNETQNKSYVVNENSPGAKLALLNYELLASSANYHLLEVTIETGRHHQIRAQLSKIGCIIKGDLKYGAKRANKDASIGLHARSLRFLHPITKEEITIVANPPADAVWDFFLNEIG